MHDQIDKLQKRVGKWAQRKYGGTQDPRRRLALVEEQVAALEANPNNLDRLARLFLFTLEYARQIKVDGFELMRIAEQRIEVDEGHLQAELKR